MKKLRTLIKLADLADKHSFAEGADWVDEQIKEAKKGYHKCGLSDKTIDLHNTLLDSYKKAQTHYEKAQLRSFKGSDPKDSPNMGELREIAKGLSYNKNAVFLHELYFEDAYNSKPKAIDKSPAKQLLNELYAAKAKGFEQDLIRMAKVPRNGWVVLEFCFVTGKLYLDAFDLHEIGVQSHTIPVLALDMWEHAYVIDFGIDKEEYAKWFLSRLNWNSIAKRIKNYQRVKRPQRPE